jgi:hypothetical protein
MTQDSWSNTEARLRRTSEPSDLEDQEYTVHTTRYERVYDDGRGLSTTRTVESRVIRRVSNFDPLEIEQRGKDGEHLHNDIRAFAEKVAMFPNGDSASRRLEGHGEGRDASAQGRRAVQIQEPRGTPALPHSVTMGNAVTPGSWRKWMWSPGEDEGNESDGHD